MVWAAIGSAAVSTIGGALLGGGSSGGQQQQTSSEPWAAQQPYLKSGFEDARKALDAAHTQGNYQGNYTAGLNPYQTQGYNNAANFAQNQGIGASNMMMQQGQNSMGYGSQFGVNAASQLQQLQQGNSTNSILGSAGQYANNPYMNGMVDAASRDVTRNLNENQLTGLDQNAAATGNMDSSRTGVAQGIMQRGAADRIGDISSTMRGNAYNTGLGMAQGQYNQDINNQSNVNGQLLSAGNFGRIATDAGLNAGYNSADALTRAGAGFQTQDQNTINGNISQFGANQNNGLNLTQKYLSMINGNFGQSTQGTSSQSGSALQGAATGLMGGMGLYGKYMGSQGNGIRQGYGSGNSSDPFVNSNADSFTGFSKNYNP